MQTDEPGSVASIDDIPNVTSIIYFFCQCEQNKLMWLYNEELHCNFHGKMEIKILYFLLLRKLLINKKHVYPEHGWPHGKGEDDIPAEYLAVIILDFARPRLLFIVANID